MSDFLAARSKHYDREPVARLVEDEPDAGVCVGCGHAKSEHDCTGMGCLFVVEDRDDEHWHPVFCACPVGFGDEPPADERVVAGDGEGDA